MHLLLLAFLGACATAPQAPATEAGGLRFTIEPRVVAPGGAVTLVLFNDTAAEIGFNLCMSALERREGSSWVAAPQQGACTRELRIAAPGRDARYQRVLPAALASGEYRFRTSVESPLMQARMQPLASESFAVRR